MGMIGARTRGGARRSLALLLMIAGLAPAQIPDGHERMVRQLAALARTHAQPAGVSAAAARLRASAAAVPRDVTAERVAGLFGSLAVAELRSGDFAAAAAGFARVLSLAPSLPGPARQGRVALGEYFSGVVKLRQWMQRVCVEARQDAGCILPVADQRLQGDPALLHQALSHLRGAVSAAGTDTPTGLAARWLAAVALSMGQGRVDGLGFSPLPAEPASAGSGSVGRFRNVAAAVGIDAFDYAGGLVVDDFDGDGYLDVFSTTTDIAGQVHLFHNRGDGAFEETTAAAGLNGITGGLNAVQADYDGDGDLDLLVLRGAWRGAGGRWPNSLLRNDGRARFRDVTYEAGLGAANYPTQVGVWADYDNDGDLDLYVANESTPGARFPSQLFRNDSGRFTDVAAAAGVENFGWSKSAAWGDYDDDGWMDLYVSNLYGANRLYHNRRDGTFEDVATGAGVSGPSSSFAAWFWDADEDGNLDLVVHSYQMKGAGGVGDVWHVGADRLGASHPAELPRLYLGDGHGVFVDGAEAWGIAHSTLPMAANFGDLDNDGWLDMYLGTGYPGFEGLVPNVMYRNDRGIRFTEVTAAGGFGTLAKGHGIAFADIDEDGDQDVIEQLGGFFPGDQYHNALFANPGGAGNWLSLDLRSSSANTRAIGAKIAIDVGELGATRTLHRVVGSGASFGANPLRVHVGLGRADGARAVRIRWPDGRRETLGPLGGGRHYRVEEGKGAAEPVSRAAFRLAGDR